MISIRFKLTLCCLALSLCITPLLASKVDEMKQVLTRLYGSGVQYQEYPYKMNEGNSVGKSNLDKSAITDLSKLSCDKDKLPDSCAGWFNYLGNMPEFVVAKGFNDQKWNTWVAGNEMLDKDQWVLTTHILDETRRFEYIQLSSVPINCDPKGTTVYLDICSSYNIGFRLCLSKDEPTETIGTWSFEQHPSCTKYLEQPRTCYKLAVKLDESGIVNIPAKPYRILLVADNHVSVGGSSRENILAIKSISVTNPDCH